VVQVKFPLFLILTGNNTNGIFGLLQEVLLEVLLPFNFLSTSNPIEINPATISALSELGFSAPKSDLVPTELFSLEALKSLYNLTIVIVAGFFIGFGTRYAGGCTSGHAITGLSNLQLPSLVAVIGFYIGGILMTYLFFPIIF
jgi:hypothetical protein